MRAVPSTPAGARAAKGRGIPGTPIAADMTAMIQRMVAGYAVVGLLPALPALLRQWPELPPGWTVSLCGVQAVVVLGMVVQAVRRRSIASWAGLFVGLTLVAALTLPFVAPSSLAGQEPFLWWQLGLSVVCAGVWRGARTAIAYAGLLALVWSSVRLFSEGAGTRPALAISEGVFAASAGLVIAITALGMLASARTADALAAEVYAAELQQALDKAVGDERARLDQLIHDDVMTTLTAAAQSTDAATGRATALLAHETLATIDALPTTAAEGSISVAVLATLAEQTVHRVSPDVVWSEQVAATAGGLRVPSAVAESLLGAVREAVRNAVHHASARRTTVQLHASVERGQLTIDARVVDDGRGFTLADVPPNRLGVRFSMLEASRKAGVAAWLRTAPGAGTEFALQWSGRPAVVNRVVPVPDDSVDRLPVDFPAGQFAAAAYASVAVGIGTGLATFTDLQHPVSVLLTMLAVVVATYLVLRPYGALTLPLRATVATSGVLAAITVLTVHTLPRVPAADMLLWYVFPVQLVIVVLVIRQRAGWALAALLVSEAGFAWWSRSLGLGWEGLLRAGAGSVLFFAMAFLVTRVLRTISRRQLVLRRQEDDAIDASVRRHVALVQRALWVADLRAQSRGILERLSETDGPVAPDLRAEALLLEATLRESLVARNVMSDELAVLTESARRRGVEVRLVDSRHTQVPAPVAQALLDAVRRALGPESVSRLVVRIAPEEGSSSASVLTEDADGTHLVQLDPAGAVASKVEAHGAHH